MSQNSKVAKPERAQRLREVRADIELGRIALNECASTCNISAMPVVKEELNKLYALEKKLIEEEPDEG